MLDVSYRPRCFYSSLCAAPLKVRGYGVTGDAHHIAAPTEDGAGPERAMLAAIGERYSVCRLLPVLLSLIQLFLTTPTFWGESTWN